MNTQKIVCFFDGACEPRNPGGAMGVGACIFVDDVQVMTHSEYIPAHKNNSNNVAEYKAFESILDFLIENNHTNKIVHIYGDSMLVIQQMKGLWRMKKGRYLEHAFACYDKIKTKFSPGCLILSWISRTQNEQADILSKGELIKHNVEFKIQPNEYK